MSTLIDIAGNALDSLYAGFKLLWSQIGPVLDDIALAVIVLALGLTVAGFISDKIGAVVKKIKVGDLLDKLIFAQVAKLTGVKIHATAVITVALRWFLIAIVLLAALDLAHMNVVINFFSDALAYVPNIIVAVLIVIMGSLLAHVAATLVSAVTKKDNLTRIAKIGVNALALIAALTHLATPVIASFGSFIGGLSLSKLQTDAVFIGVLVLVLLASKNAIIKTVENLHKD
ncbi:MAG: hypothetical protein HYR97_02100 [Candidatus Melainabacteria bacterium]|nr:hypothetical protein [Candidatus Melainabacteria bacterium]MBI3307976.1 hypothetical protein [Candidatus Melainabacteria bacterium]